MSRLGIAFFAASLASAIAISPARTANSIAFGDSAASCGGRVLCSRDGTHGYLNNGSGRAFRASTIRQWFQIDADGKTHLKGQGAEPLRGTGAFAVVNDTGRPITKFALQIATGGKACAGGKPCNAFSAEGGRGAFHYDGMLTSGAAHKCTEGKATGQICVGDPVSVTFASNKVLYSWTARPQGAIPKGAYFLITFSGWSSSAWTAPPTPPSLVMLSRGTDGLPGNFNSCFCGPETWTADGNNALFISGATNLPGASQIYETIYTYSLPSGTYIPVFTPIHNFTALAHTSISADGTIIGYGAGGEGTVYIYDSTTQTTQQIHPAPPFDALLGSFISSDGRYFLYGTGEAGYSSVFVYDRTAGTTNQLFAPDGSLPNNTGCEPISMTGNGQSIVSNCTSDNLVPGVIPGSFYLWDQFANTIDLIDSSTEGNKGVRASAANGLITPDGRYILFDTTATNLVPGGTTGQQVFLYDSQTKAIQLVSSASDGTEGNTGATGILLAQVANAVSPDGRYAVFVSTATNLGAPLSPNILQAYRKDILTGAIQELSAASDGTPGNDQTPEVNISPDGTQAEFTSHATNLVQGGSNQFYQVYLATIQSDDAAVRAVGTRSTKYALAGPAVVVHTPSNPHGSNFHVGAPGKHCSKGCNLTFVDFCDGMQLQTADGVNFISAQTGACLQGTSVTGSGRVIGGQLTLTVNWSGFTRTSDKKRYVLDYPLVSGGAFKEYAFQNAVGPSVAPTLVLLNSGTYTLQP